MSASCCCLYLSYLIFCNQSSIVFVHALMSASGLFSFVVCWTGVCPDSMALAFKWHWPSVWVMTFSYCIPVLHYRGMISGLYAEGAKLPRKVTVCHYAYALESMQLKLNLFHSSYIYSFTSAYLFLTKSSWPSKLFIIDSKGRHYAGR